MWRRLPIVAAVLGGAAAMVVLVMALAWQPWGSVNAPRSTTPSMTLEGVIALVSREHVGCPDQAPLVLTADAVYEGDGRWRVTYREYEWIVDESDGSVEAVGDTLPCPSR